MGGLSWIRRGGLALLRFPGIKVSATARLSQALIVLSTCPDALGVPWYQNFHDQGFLSMLWPTGCL